jgi:hypothetical protein
MEWNILDGSSLEHLDVLQSVNRDRNASANIVWNVIYAAMGLLDSTTWIIGKN